MPISIQVCYWFGNSSTGKSYTIRELFKNENNRTSFSFPFNNEYYIHGLIYGKTLVLDDQENSPIILMSIFDYLSEYSLGIDTIYIITNDSYDKFRSKPGFVFVEPYIGEVKHFTTNTHSETELIYSITQIGL